MNLIPVSLDIETSSESGKKEDNLNHLKNKIECIAECTEKGSFIYEHNFDFDASFERLYIMHNAMFDLKTLAWHNGWTEDQIMMCNIFDTYVASRLIDENLDGGLKELSKIYLGKDRSDDTYKIKSQGTREAFLNYCKTDAEDTYALYPIFRTELERQGLSDLFNLEMEVVKKMICAELRGVKLDVPKLHKLQVKFSKNRDKLKQGFLKKFTLSDEFNMNSPKQLQTLFFTTLGLVPKKLSAKGSPSTNVAALDQMALEGVDAARWVLSFRKYEMVERQTVKLINSAHEGRVHCSFNIVGTESGRFSCKNPNLQQVAAKSSMGMAIRSCFVGDLTVADFDNIELRLLAHFSNDPMLLNSYIAGHEIDVHQQTADILGVSRSAGKTLNFGILYGMGPQKLANDLKIDIEEAKQLLDSWFQNYHYVKEWKDKVIYKANVNGFVESLSGRRRHVPELKGCLTFQKRNRDELRLMYALQREAVNFILQGSSADITKKAIVNLRDENIILQVHDELIIEDCKRSTEQVKHVLDNLVQLNVPITATVQRVSNWSLAKVKLVKELVTI